MISDNYEESKCLACERGFYLDEERFECKSCDGMQEGCLECAQGFCFKCEEEFNLVDGHCIRDDFHIPYCIEREGLSCKKCEKNFIIRDGKCACEQTFTVQNG